MCAKWYKAYEDYKCQVYGGIIEQHRSRYVVQSQLLLCRLIHTISIFAKLNEMEFGPDIKNLGKDFQGLSECIRWVIEKPFELSEEGALIV